MSTVGEMKEKHFGMLVDTVTKKQKLNQPTVHSFLGHKKPTRIGNGSCQPDIRLLTDTSNYL